MFGNFPHKWNSIYIEISFIFYDFFFTPTFFLLPFFFTPTFFFNFFDEFFYTPTFFSRIYKKKLEEAQERRAERHYFCSIYVHIKIIYKENSIEMKNSSYWFRCPVIIILSFTKKNLLKWKILPIDLNVFSSVIIKVN